MNSARRLFEIFTSARSQRAAHASYLTWVQAFELQAERADQHEDIGMACIVAVREEIELLRAALRDKDCPEKLYVDSLNSLKSIAAPSQIAIPWNQIVDRIGVDHLMMLNWAGWLLGKEEVLLSNQERTKLLEEVEKMIVEIEAAGLPNFTKQLVRRHLETVRRALNAYKAQGIEPLMRALNETTGAMTTQKTHIATDVAKADGEAKGVIAKAMGVLSKVADFADKAQKVQKGIDSVAQIAHHVNTLWHQLPDLPALPGAG
jgi:hypothetical protein